MSKKGKKPSAIKKQARINRAMREIEPIVVPLCELFAVTDDVFTEEGAFTDEHIKKSLGRIYRAWKETRAALDPEFNPNDYDRRPRKAGKNPNSPLVTGSQRSSSDQKSISERRKSPKGKSEKTSVKKSVKSVR